MKARVLLMIAAFFCLPTKYSIGQSTSLLNDSIIEENNRNICSSFATEEYLAAENTDATLPVRTLEDVNQTSLTPEELRLYQKLGLTNLGNGSYGCLIKDPDNPNRKYTIFKVKKLDQVLVVSTFLKEGKFIIGQKTAATRLFIEMIGFYTEIPKT